MNLISFIIIIVFIRKMIKKANEKNGTRQKVQTKRTETKNKSQPIENLRKMTSYSQPRKNDDYYQQQKNTKERLQKKYGLKQTNNLQNKTSQKSDILSRAKENVQENETNILSQQIHTEVCTEYQNSSSKIADVKVHKMQSDNCDTAGESDILKKVNDLMVMGYSGEMNFDRDFIAEGVDLLNRYSL